VESREFERSGIRGQHTIIHTPIGELSEEKLFEPTFGGPAIKKHFVQDLDDYPVLMAYLHDLVVCDDRERFWRDWRELGDDGLPLVAVCRTPFQQLWIEWVSLEDLAVHLAEQPEVVEECMSLLAAIERRVFQVVWRACGEVPITHVDFPDNITAPVIGPVNFAKYCSPLYDELAAMLADRGVPVFVHMDGDLKPLWQLIGNSSIQGIDSLSPPPDNDTSVGQALAMWPGKRLFVNFPSSVHLAQAEEVYQVAERILAEGGHSGRLAIQISENVPPGLWRKSFPEIMRAVEAFGPP
ncbi:MAG: uroporphyrinogen decarboxylase family protein, partial [Anaerolineae bacterium]|nr:uroporphyrinogen decarboxylase family protein [Anaerolineae bacterium]